MAVWSQSCGAEMPVAVEGAAVALVLRFGRVAVLPSASPGVTGRLQSCVSRWRCPTCVCGAIVVWHRRNFFFVCGFGCTCVKQIQGRVVYMEFMRFS